MVRVRQGDQVPPLLLLSLQTVCFPARHLKKLRTRPLLLLINIARAGIRLMPNCPHSGPNQIMFCRKVLSVYPIISRSIHTSRVLLAEPPKKKKKLDIQIVKLRVERKIKKLEKEIRRLKKTPKQLKPIEEYQLPPQIMKELSLRKRPETQEDEAVEDSVRKLSRLWILYNQVLKNQEAADIRKVMASQQRALEVLKTHSLELYLAALEIDESLIPFEDNKIITETHRNPDYEPPDGLRSDVSKVWTM